jgi:hypothetical protein
MNIGQRLATSITSIIVIDRLRHNAVTSICEGVVIAGSPNNWIRHCNKQRLFVVKLDYLIIEFSSAQNIFR